MTEFDYIFTCVDGLRFEDGLHLTDDGKVILANNCIYVLKIGLSYETKKNCNGTSKNDFLLIANFYNDNYESSNISNSSGVKESYPVFAMMWLETRI